MYAAVVMHGAGMTNIQVPTAQLIRPLQTSKAAKIYQAHC